MGNFNRSGGRSKGGFNQGFGGGRKRFGDRGGRDGGRPTMHQAVCSECGAACELPFRPSGDRPVFCNDCFSKQDKGGERQNRFGGERRERPRFEDKKMFDAVCDQCGKDCQVPFRPTAGKPVLCNSCFGKDGKASKDFTKKDFGSKDSSGTAEQIKILNAKIDQLIKILTPSVATEKIAKPEIKKEVKKEKVAEKKTKAKTAIKKATAKKKK